MMMFVDSQSSGVEISGDSRFMPFGVGIMKIPVVDVLRYFNIPAKLV